MKVRTDWWRRAVAPLAAALLLAACQATPTATPTAPPAGTPEPGQTPAASPQAGGEVEIFSWWTAGGEADGLEAMFEVFAQKHPEFQIVNAAVAGGAGTNARAVLATRLAQGDPPESWQGHAGQELSTYIVAGQLEPLNSLFDEQGWHDVMPATLIEQISTDGNIWSVPVNIHRANVMWYVPANLEQWGVQVPQTWAEFLTAAETLEAAGVTPLALGEQWTVMHLLETVLLGELGADAYASLWDGSGDWNSAEVTAALETFDQVLDYTNADASTLAWEQAAQLVIDGQAAFNVMGDWAEGYFVSPAGPNLSPEDGSFGWAPAPGSSGVFQWLSDSFILPAGEINREGALAWLTVAGSKEGQDAFNPVKGSIPARTDPDRSLYDAYLQSAMDDWASDELAGSLTHGVVANDAWKAAIDTALGLFLADRNVGTFQTALAAACVATGPCS
ncbi:MAG TPA: ABC transporter substrate-binding protein [Candidatus Limnocylindria bacterium]|jgi:glucose/mannose transport system substrate-binding protein|nr:ABC transporter substrate-binding protein [Candidatus Limnocylindria bacterium]